MAAEIIRRMFFVHEKKFDRWLVWFDGSKTLTFWCVLLRDTGKIGNRRYVTPARNANATTLVKLARAHLERIRSNYDCKLARRVDVRLLGERDEVRLFKRPLLEAGVTT